jgi:hypothetical protein
VLRGLRETLVRDRPIVAFEALEPSATSASVAILREAGYREFLGLGRVASSLRKLLLGLPRPEPMAATSRYGCVVAWT